jgi:hypothetical protein
MISGFHPTRIISVPGSMQRDKMQWIAADSRGAMDLPPDVRPSSNLAEGNWLAQAERGHGLARAQNSWRLQKRPVQQSMHAGLMATPSCQQSELFVQAAMRITT